MAYVIGLDIGTTNIKALLLDLEGNEILFSSQSTGVQRPGPAGWAEYNPERVYAGVVFVIRDLVEKIDRPEAIQALAISSMGETAVPLNEHGDWLYPAIAWYDDRTLAQRDWWQEHVGFETTYAFTGLPPSTSYGLLKLMWLRDNVPETFAQIRTFIPIGDYVAYRLSGVLSTDYTLGWRSMALDIGRLAWSEAILQESGIDAALMPSLVPSGVKRGTIHRAAARDTGLPPSCQVVSGAMDAICGMVAVGAGTSNIALDIIGSSELVLVSHEKPTARLDFLRSSLDIGPHAMPGKYLAFGSMTSAGTIVDWYAKTLGCAPGQETAECLAHLAEEISRLGEKAAPVLWLPHFLGSRTPFSDQSSRGALVGVGLETTRAEVFLGLLEGLCLENRRVFEALYRVTRQWPELTWVAGGGAKNLLWLRLKSDILQSDIQVTDSVCTSAHGAAILAASGSGAFANLDDAIARMQCKHRVIRYESDHLTGYHTRYAAAYDKLYESLRSVFQALAG